MKNRIRFSVSILSVAMIVMGALSTNAQVRPPVPRGSQKAMVMQTLGTTEVSVTYSRPVIAGRKVFGDWTTSVAGEATLDNQNTRPKDAPLVPWGHVWRAGANEATLFAVSDDVMINGQALPAGKYSLHAIPGKDDWTFIFNKDEGQWGSFNYDSKKDAIRVKSKPEWLADSVELLTFTIDADAPAKVGDATSKGTVWLRWEKLRVPFTVEVKDLVGSTMTRLRAYVADAKADEWQRPLNAANYAKANKMADDAAKWYEQAVKAIDLQIAAKPNFVNYRQKATILIGAGRMQEALASAEKAVEVGKAEKADAAQISALEKRISDIKAGKP